MTDSLIQVKGNLDELKAIIVLWHEAERFRMKSNAVLSSLHVDLLLYVNRAKKRKRRSNLGTPPGLLLAGGEKLLATRLCHFILYSMLLFFLKDSLLNCGD